MLALTGGITTMAATGFAGCVEAMGLGEDTTPSYANWIAADDGVGFVYVDWAALEATNFGDATTGDTTDDARVKPETDSLAALPFEGFFLVSLVVSAGLNGSGVDTLTTLDDSSTDDERNTRIDEFLLTDGTLVMSGDVDVEEVHELLTGEPTNEWWRREYERAETVEGFEVYQLSEGEFAVGTPRIAVRDDAVVCTWWSESTDTIRTPIEAEAGQRDRAVDTWDDVKWLLDVAGDGDIALGAYGETWFEEDVPDDEQGDDETLDQSPDMLEEAEGFLGSVTFDADATRTAFAGLFHEIDEHTESDLEDALASTADERTIDVDPERNRVETTAVWYDDEDPSSDDA